MPKDDLEVFEHLLSDEDTKVEIDYLSYSIFAHRKRYWIEKFNELNGKKPNQNEIDNWISQLSDYEFHMMRVEAAEFFHNAAADYMEDKIAAARKQGSNDAIAASVDAINAQIRSLGRFRNQLLIALMTAVLTPIILGGSILFLKTYEDRMPSALRLFSDKPPTTNLPAAPLPSPALPK